MVRTALWLLAGLLLGGLIHLVVVLTLPSLAEETVWDRIGTLEAENRIVVMPPVEAGGENPFGLDPLIIYGICQVDLSTGPAYMNGVLPDAFWSVAVYDRDGTVIYSTTNRDGIGTTLDLGIFNAAQTRLLAQQEIDINEGLLIVESPSDPLFITVRLAPPYTALRTRYAEEMANLTCGTRQ